MQRDRRELPSAAPTTSIAPEEAIVIPIGPRVPLPPSLARIALHVASGLADKEIARALGIPLATVRTYVQRVYARLGVRSRIELRARFWSVPSGPTSHALPPSLARVADEIARGLTDKEIAQTLGMSVATVRTYVQRIYARLGVHSRVELARAWRPPSGPAHVDAHGELRARG